MFFISAKINSSIDNDVSSSAPNSSRGARRSYSSQVPRVQQQRVVHRQPQPQHQQSRKPQSQSFLHRTHHFSPPISPPEKFFIPSPKLFDDIDTFDSLSTRSPPAEIDEEEEEEELFEIDSDEKEQQSQRTSMSQSYSQSRESLSISHGSSYGVFSPQSFIFNDPNSDLPSHMLNFSTATRRINDTFGMKMLFFLIRKCLFVNLCLRSTNTT